MAGLKVTGDVQGLPLGSQLVSALQGRPVSSKAPTLGQKLTWNGSAWVPGAVAPTQQALTSASGTYTTPAGCTAILVECIAGGGAGGGCPTTAAANFGAGGGGAGGGYAAGIISNPAASYSYVVGGGGAGVLNANGGGGGDTTFASTLVVAKGGAGGQQTGQNVANSFLGTPGSPGVAGTGLLKVIGGAGLFGWSLAALAVGGAGGQAARGGSGAGQNLATSQDGAAGGSPGGGGSGAVNQPSQGTARTGGAGAAGIIIVTEFY